MEGYITLHWNCVPSRQGKSTTNTLGCLVVQYRASVRIEDRASMIELGFESFESSMETRKNGESNELVA